MAREYTCDNCGNTFADKYWIWPVDEKRDYCDETCYEEAKVKGQVIDCPTCNSEVSKPHNCPWKK